MNYPFLTAAVPSANLAARAQQCALAVMAKAPRPGKVKTRLSPPLTAEQAAAINICFLQDTMRNIADVSSRGTAAGVISYTPVGEESAFDNLVPESFTLIPQRGDTFDERLLATAEDILACGYASVCLIDSDSPTVPAAAFEQAIEALAQPGDRIVLGPSSDGGYYLIGLKHPHAEPFTNITWSTSSVFNETCSRIAAAGIELVTLPLWYDVDDAETLDLLAAELLEATPPAFIRQSGYPAPRTRSFLQQLRAPLSA